MIRLAGPLMRLCLQPFFLSLLVVVLLPNIVFISAATWLDLNRPFINLDYLFVTLLILAKLRFLGISLFILLFLIDALALTGQIFLFIRPDSLFYLAKFLPETSGVYQLSIVGIAILLFGLLALFYNLPRYTNPLHALVLFNICLVFYAINVYGERDSQERIWRVQHSPLVDSQFLFLFDQRSDLFLQSFNSTGPALSDKKIYGASDEWFKTDFTDKNKKLMLIASESWGIPKNQEIQSALLKPLINLSRKLDNFSSGQISFSGPTVAAELRELCQLTPFHYNFKDTSTGFENCLPNKLKQAGYKTHAIHAATGVMYDRIYWYPRAGFSETTFFETKQWPRRCYSFPGACDTDLMETASKVFSEAEPTFLYWLTLNSHSVYDARDIHIDLFDCARFGVETGTQTCRNLKLHAQFFYTLAMAIDSGNFENVEVIIVGDHSPIITSPEEKEKYFIDQKVPWVRFSINGKFEVTASKKISVDNVSEHAHVSLQ